MGEFDAEGYAKSPAAEAYSNTADELVKRIVALGADVVLPMASPWDLFKTEIKTEDLGPSLFQAAWALAKAKSILREK